MIEITEKPISPELVVDRVKTDSSGCVVTYIGLIRNYSQGKPVLSVEYEEARHKAEDRLQQIAKEVGQRWQLDNLAICHRVGKLKVGDINVVIAVAAAHRQQGFAACQYAIDRIKQTILKKETYTDGSIWVEGKPKIP